LKQKTLEELLEAAGNPVTFSATPASYRLPPPSLDQHGEEIRRWLAEPEPDDKENAT